MGDVGLLALALVCPATAVMGTEAYPRLAMKATALLDSVARSRPLIDGNKRTAWTLVVLLLWINGYRHDFELKRASIWLSAWPPAASICSAAPS
ncbi:Fic family protein [Arthrobacter sp. MI7-26]|uniref:type II toxin-antitoxin system death-on-curing family toxin n=1 Tax=Arthrobacter sp. MI7-26 TaxID=2993653 RepID=UPI00224896B8|nr:Fic family protein [Arthrobacter sp. MI7-26]MCX2749821.1 Fic family protein [Arthrobacter sp. MI7-26]